MQQAPTSRQLWKRSVIIYRVSAYLIAAVIAWVTWYRFFDEPLIRYFLALIPFLIVLTFDTLPTWLSHRNHLHLIARGRHGSLLPPAYFRLGPYENNQQDRDLYTRADHEHEYIFDWLTRGNSRVCYLTGRSGVGKSSLFHAHVQPKLTEAPYFWRVIFVHASGDPLADMALALANYDDQEIENPTIEERLTLMARANRSPLLLVLDQFEEALVSHREGDPILKEFVALLRFLEEKGPANLKLLLVFRNDYLHLLGQHHFPAPRADRNWRQVPPFLAEDARAFLENSNLQLNTKQLDRMMHDIFEIEETKGLVRPVTLNMIGLALQHTGNQKRLHLDYEYGVLALTDDYLRRCINLPGLRRHALPMLRHMLTEDGTKQRRTLNDLAQHTDLPQDIVRGCLMLLGNRGLVIKATDKHWEIAHDFVARQLDLILRKWRLNFFPRLRLPLLATGLIVWAISLFGLYPLWQMSVENRALTDLVRAGAEVSEESDGFSVRFRNHPRLDMTVQYMRELDNLYRIDLSGTSVTDLTALQALPNLVALHLSATAHADLNTLHSVPWLKFLDLSRTNLHNPSRIIHLQGLERLDLSETPVEHINGLHSLPNLVALHLRQTGVRSLKIEQDDLDFANMSLNELMRVQVSPEDVPYLTELSALKQLTWLDLKHTAVDYLDPLVVLNKLEKLELSDTNVENLDPLTQLKTLRYLDLDRTHITHLASLETLVYLEYLSLDSTKVSSLAPLSKLAQLKVLNLARTDIHDLQPIAELDQLTELDVSYTFISEIAALTNLPRMMKLNLRGTSISSLADLQRIESLETLNISDTEISDLTPLSQANQLRQLNLSRTPVVDLTPLRQIRTLKEIMVGGEQAPSKRELEALREALPELKITSSASNP